jgi:hypothetical protein
MYALCFMMYRTSTCLLFKQNLEHLHDYGRLQIKSVCNVHECEEQEQGTDLKSNDLKLNIMA